MSPTQQYSKSLNRKHIYISPQLLRSYGQFVLTIRSTLYIPSSNGLIILFFINYPAFNGWNSRHLRFRTFAPPDFKFGVSARGNHGFAPERDCTHGIAPTGLHPHGIAPNGIAPTELHPQYREVHTL